MTQPCASMTARLAKFSDAIKMRVLRCRSSSACIAAATSGSTTLNGFNQITVNEIAELVEMY
jgi:hypothetical protein